MGGTLLFTCPNTRRQAPTDILTDVQSLSALWTKTVKVNCSLGLATTNQGQKPAR
jgi:hypothetical protein